MVTAALVILAIVLIIGAFVALFGSELSGVGAIICLVFLGLGIFSGFGAFRYGPEYDVWQQGLLGQAELKRAEQNRQIRVQEAQARLDAAALTAQAEVAQAKGAAEANNIMKESLGGTNGYLRWKYINMLEEKRDRERTVIYVPTENQMPIMEAGRRK